MPKDAEAAAEESVLDAVVLDVLVFEEVTMAWVVVSLRVMVAPPRIVVALA